MSDHYSEFVQSSVGRKIAQNLGLPLPTTLERFKEGQAPITGRVIFGSSLNGFAGSIAKILANTQAQVFMDAAQSASAALTQAHISASAFTAEQTYKVAIFDASGIQSVDDLKQVYTFFHPIARSIEKSGRVVVLGLPPEQCQSIAQSRGAACVGRLCKISGKRI